MKPSQIHADMWNIDFSNDIRSYEFSKHAFQKVGRMIHADDFKEKESGEILQFLLHELKLIPFSEYLKRYIYLESDMDIPFENVRDDLYADILLSGFKENHVPFHTQPCTTTPRRFVNRWLKQSTVKRNVVFLLGFAMKMTTDSVSKFLQKALLEEDFNFDDPQELIYWFCYDQKLPYSYAVEKINEYEVLDITKLKKRRRFMRWEDCIKRLEYRVDPYGCLDRYLMQLKTQSGNTNGFSSTLKVFRDLYDAVCRQIVMQRMYESRGMVSITADMIMPVDVEKELYPGIPRSDEGNLQKASASSLALYMRNHYLSRQRIEKLLNGKYPVRRFDILNLCFYLHAVDNSACRTTKERFLYFVQDVNERLEQCHMYPLHPSNPSEAFMMICLFTEMPLITYSDVLEMSFQCQESREDADEESDHSVK